MGAKLKPWDRQPDESGPAYEAFLKFRDLSVAKRFQKLVAQDVGKSRHLINRWHAQWAWDERVQAWDREQDRLWQLEQHEQRRIIARQHATLASSVLAKVARRLSNVSEREVDRMSFGQIRDLMALAVRTQREAYGLNSGVDLNLSGEVRTPESDTARKILVDPEATELALQLAERLHGVPISSDASAPGDEGDRAPSP